MATSCPEPADLAPTPRIAQAPRRRPEVNSYPTSEGTLIEVDRGITAAELGLGLAMQVPATAPLTASHVDEDGDLELYFGPAPKLP